MSLSASAVRLMRRYFIAGLLVWVPIFITFFVLHFVVNLLDSSLALLPKHYAIPGVGVIFTLIVLLLTGAVVTNFIGNRLLTAWEHLVSRIPLIRSIHSATKQVVHAVIQPNGNAFRKVVLIPYPHPGSWSLAFVTSGVINSPWTSQEIVNVFVPTTPNPTSGFLLFIPVQDTIELNMSVEEALRMVISLGVIIPDWMKKDLVPGEQNVPISIAE